MNGIVNVRVTRGPIVPLPADMGSSGSELPTTAGEVIFHELGHAATEMGLVLTPPAWIASLFGLRQNRNPEFIQVSNRAAVNFENRARKARNPNAPIRTRHNIIGSPF
jgi:hypothetical protein